jgi:hypothetical protein
MGPTRWCPMNVEGGVGARARKLSQERSRLGWIGTGGGGQEGWSIDGGEQGEAGVGSSSEVRQQARGPNREQERELGHVWAAAWREGGGEIGARLRGDGQWIGFRGDDGEEEGGAAAAPAPPSSHGQMALGTSTSQ